MAARALGFAGYGQEKIVDPQFKEEYPVLLTPLADPIEEQEARRQINEAALACYFGLPLWQTPMYRQDEGPVLIVAWSPVFQQNRRSRCDPKRVAPPECNMMVGESVLEQSANGG